MMKRLARNTRWPAALLMLAAAFAVGCSINPVTGQQELILIPENQEIAMGVQAAPGFEKEFGGKVADPRLQAYVQEVGKRVAGVSDRKMPYEFTLVSSKVPNAFALPGGRIFLTAGLMVRMTNERQLAAVLGHETGHVAAKHNVKGMQRQVGASVLTQIAAQVAGEDKAAAAEMATKVVTGMANLKYSRDDEYQADAVGIKYMARAGYNPYGMVELLTVLLNLSESEPGALAEMLQTHPVSSKRIEEAKGIIKADEQYNRFLPTAPDPNAPRFQAMRQALVTTVPGLK